MRNWCYSDAPGALGSVGLLVLRLVMGTAFVLHGWPKIQSPFDWMGPEAATPGFVLALAAFAEFAGGLALIPGILTRLAALAIAVVMVGAIAIVHWPEGHPFVSAGGPSHELAAVYLACAVLLLSLGAGRFSLDALLCGRPRAAKLLEEQP